MSRLLFSPDDELNMHVKPEPVGEGVDLPTELTEAMLNAQKAGTRAILAQRLELLWQTCEPYIRDCVGDAADVRMMKLGLDIVDRLLKVHEVLAPDRAVREENVTESITKLRRDEILADLQARGARMLPGGEVITVGEAGEDTLAS